MVLAQYLSEQISLMRIVFHTDRDIPIHNTFDLQYNLQSTARSDRMEWTVVDGWHDRNMYAGILLANEESVHLDE